MDAALTHHSLVSEELEEIPPPLISLPLRTDLIIYYKHNMKMENKIMNPVKIFIRTYVRITVPKVKKAKTPSATRVVSPREQ